ncbi:MAG: CBS domain-containing protein [Candidatus Sericytochromatia bacterium]|nr:CBS domain-containing protein [Candidatus Tanganyikabacteria bacterium]
MSGEIIAVPADIPAARLMSRPVQTVAPDTPLAEAHGAFMRTGHRTLPVVSDGRPVGLLGRTDCERAVRHGLGDHVVSQAMGPAPPAVTTDASAGEVLRILGAPGPGRVLVTGETGELCGIISRSDLLVRLLGQAGDGGPPGAVATDMPPGFTVLEIASLLEARWAPAELQLLRRISRECSGRRLYLVGGAVRDLLLGRPSYDLDLMVEDSGQQAARHLATVLGAEVSVHEPFGTATLVLPGGRRIDVATSRAELYSRPGALPEVTPAGLLHDLARRDFTLNALAMRVDPGAWGRVIDPYGGLDDLEHGRLRVLYTISFIEDPTRLVRGVRFERKFGLRLEPRTAELARFALASGKLDALGGERLKNELRKLLALPDLAGAVSRLAEFDAWRLLHPALAGTAPDAGTLERLEAVLREWPELAGDDALAARYRGTLAVVLAPLGPERAREALASLHSAGEDIRGIVQAIQAGADLGDRLRDLLAGQASERFRAFRQLGADALRHLAALSGLPAVRAAAVEHLAVREVRLLAVDGDWLKAQGVAPGPLLGKVLDDTLMAVIDRIVPPDPEAQRRFALARARELGAVPGGRS